MVSMARPSTRVIVPPTLRTTLNYKMSQSTRGAGPPHNRRVPVCTAVKRASGVYWSKLVGHYACRLPAGMVGGHGKCPAVSMPSRRSTVMSRNSRCRLATTPSVTSHRCFSDSSSQFFINIITAYIVHSPYLTTPIHCTITYKNFSN